MRSARPCQPIPSCNCGRCGTWAIGRLLSVSDGRFRSSRVGLFGRVLAEAVPAESRAGNARRSAPLTRQHAQNGRGRGVGGSQSPAHEPSGGEDCPASRQGQGWGSPFHLEPLACLLDGRSKALWRCCEFRLSLRTLWIALRPCSRPHHRHVFDELDHLLCQHPIVLAFRVRQRIGNPLPGIERLLAAEPRRCTGLRLRPTFV